ELRFQEPAELPTLAQMLEQRLAAELGQHVNGIDARVDEIAQDEIDDAVFASERNGWFRPFPRKRVEARALAAGQYDAQHSNSHTVRLKPYCSSKLRFPQLRFVRMEVLYAKRSWD